MAVSYSDLDKIFNSDEDELAVSAFVSPDALLLAPAFPFARAPPQIRAF